MAKRGGNAARVDPKLKKFINKLMTDAMNDQEASLTDKVKVIDRALKLAAIEAKFDDGGYGTGFNNDDNGDSDAD